MSLSNRVSQFFRFVLFYLALIFLCLPQLFSVIRSNDVWKSLYTGRYLNLFHKFPHHSTFTFSPTIEFLSRNTFTWMGNLFLYTLYDVGGLSSLQGIRILLGLAFAIFLHSIVDFEVNPVWLILITLGVMCINQKLLIRNAMFAIPFTCLLVAILGNIHFYASKKYIWFVPLILYFWSNFHGSYVIGITVFFAFMLGEILDHLVWVRNESWKWSVKLFGAGLLSITSISLLKPFPDYRFLKYMQGFIRKIFFTDQTSSVVASNLDASIYTQIRTLLQSTFITKSKTFIGTEYNFPLESLSLLYVKVGILLSVVIIGTLLWNRIKSFSLIFPVVGSLILGFAYLRTVGYIALVSFPLVLMTLKKRNQDTILKNKLFNFTVLIMICFGLGYVGFYVSKGTSYKITNYRNQYVSSGLSPRYRTNLPDTILRKYRNKSVDHPTSFGSYLVWNWWPYKKVLFDTKTSAYKQLFWKEIKKLGIEGYVNHKKIDLILLPRTHDFVNYKLRPSKQWRLAKVDNLWALYLRSI